MCNGIILLLGSGRNMSKRRKSACCCRCNSVPKKEICRHNCRHYPSTISVFIPLSGAGNLTAAQAPGTDVHVTGSSLNDCLNAFYIGLPGTIASSVRVADLNAKGDIFSAKFTSGHCCTSLPCAMGISAKRHSRSGRPYIIAEDFSKCKH